MRGLTWLLLFHHLADGVPPEVVEFVELQDEGVVAAFDAELVAADGADLDGRRAGLRPAAITESQPRSFCVWCSILCLESLLNAE